MSDIGPLFTTGNLAIIAMTFLGLVAFPVLASGFVWRRFHLPPRLAYCSHPLDGLRAVIDRCGGPRVLQADLRRTLVQHHAADRNASSSFSSHFTL